MTPFKVDFLLKLTLCGLQVRQWIAGRVTTNSSPGSPSTTSSSYPRASPSTDWSTPRRDKSSPLRGPHGKFVSPSSVCGYSSSSSTPDQGSSQRLRGERHTDMAELAKHVSEHPSAQLHQLKQETSETRRTLVPEEQG